MDPEDLMLVPQVKEMTDPSISCNLLDGSGLVFLSSFWNLAPSMSRRFQWKESSALEEIRELG